MTMQPFNGDRIGFIAPMYWGGGADGDGRDMTGSAPTPRPSGLTTSWGGQSFEGRPHAGNFGDIADDAIDPETPEDLLIALEEEMTQCRDERKSPLEYVIRVDGKLLRHHLEGTHDPSARLFPNLRGVAVYPQRKRRRRGGHGRGRRQ